MHIRDISKVLGAYLFFFSLILCLPFGLSLYDQFYLDPIHHPQSYCSGSFLVTIMITLTAAIFLYSYGKGGHGRLFRREGILAVVLVWLLTPLFGGIPFYVSDTLQNPVFAYFEAMSGFTTTGATVMQAKKFDLSSGEETHHETSYTGIEEVSYSYKGTIEPIRDAHTGEILYEGIEAVSRALLFWRCMMQWLGGGGIMVLFVAVLPALGVGGKMLMQSEVTGPIKDALTPRIKETAIQLWKIYFSLTLLEIFLLYVTNPEMDLFNSVAVTFSTLSTGGFSVRNESIGGYGNSTTEWIVLAFMILGSVNFSLYFFCLRGKFFKLWDPELILFLTIALGISSFATWQILGTNQAFLSGAIGTDYTLGEAIRAGSFQLVSAMTSTGFSVANYEMWPYVVQVLMLIVMYIGGMSGSTAGGMKVIRHLMLFRISQNKVESLFRPEAVRSIKIGYKEIDTSVAINVLSFFFLVLALAVLGTFLYTLDGIDPETAIGLISCMINNTGIAFRQAGATNSFAFLSDSSALLSCFWMILGRLEVFAVLVLLVPTFWREEV